MTVRQYMLGLLKALEFAVPPPPNCHHCVTYARFGSDAEGWGDRLALQINREGKFYCFFLDDLDLPYDPDDGDLQCVVAKIVLLLQVPDASFQLGVGPGRYV